MKNDLFTLAQQAARALTAYENGLAKKKAGHTEVINAVIEYGKALFEGRTLHKSDKKFGEWIEDNGLDQIVPFNQRQNRQAAQQLAKIATDTSSRVSNIFECPNSRPNDIMIWVRKQPWYEPPQRAPKAPKRPKRATRGRPRNNEVKPTLMVPMAPNRSTNPIKPLTREEVDPEFVGSEMDWIDKYGHVQVMTAEQYATARFGGWSKNVVALVREWKRLPELYQVDHNWLRSPKETDIKRLSEALEFLRPLMAEAEALLARARNVQALRQQVDESLRTL